MDATVLKGKKVQVTAGDLFSLPVSAVICSLDVGSHTLLLEFDRPLSIESEMYSFAVARPRLARDKLENLLNEGAFGCALICVPRERHNPANPFDLSWWRGGGAAVAELRLC